MKIPVAQPDLTGNELNYVSQAIQEGWVSSAGRFLEQFERDFAAYCGTRHAIAACNGTVVIHLLMLAMGIGPGDEVIVPSFTYVASANGVAYTGAKPILVDSLLDSWNVDPVRIEAAITPRTKAIMAVHLYGHPADMDAIRAIGDRHGIPVIEDAAEAHGAEVRGRRVGQLGLAATFSFYGNKIITTGEGGMITTDDTELAAKIRQLRGQGMDPQRRYWFPIIGYNYRMTNLSAALGCAQLERIDQLIAHRVRIAETYNECLRPVASELGISLPVQAPWAKSVYWLYCIRVPAAQRDPLMQYLASIGIETRPFFPPMHHLPMYSDPAFVQGAVLPVADELGATGINLPTWNGLDASQIQAICTEISGFLRRG
jgi:perosamine synthetase